MRKSYLMLAVIALVALGFAVSAHAGTTGKVQGVVKDAQSGEPLPGANVVLEGTQRGATTDVNGFYVILLVDPDRYTMVASMVGYDKQTQTDVRVQSDFTTELNFMLRETSLELGEMVVVAERPPVEPDRTTTKYVVSSQDIEDVPIVRSAEDFVELQAGVSVDGEVSIRAGDSEDVGYYLDGVRMTSTDHRGTRVYRDVNRTAIQELTVITGGMDAEYGNAQGGVVSFVTREGGQKYHGFLDYQFQPAGQSHWGPEVYDSNINRGNNKWDDPDWVGETITLTSDDAPWVTAGETVTMQAHQRLDYTGKSGHWLEGHVSGPVMRDLTFFASSKWRRTAVTFPDAYLTTPLNTNTDLKLSYTASPNLKVRAGGFYNQRKGTFTGPDDGGRLNLRNNLKNLFLVVPNATGDYMDTDALLWGSVTHSLSPKTFYELRLSLAKSSRDTLNLQQDGSNPSLNRSGNAVKDKSGHYSVYRNVMNWETFSRNRLILNLDVSSQASKQHFLKTGIEMVRYNNWHQRYWSDGSNHGIATWYTKTYNDVDFFPGQETKGVSPIQIGVYVQDKIEFEGMIVNAGIRGDAFLQREWVTDVDCYYGASSPMWNNMARNRYVPTIKGPAIKSVSPRLGISHPITSKSLIRFFYGKFTQLPTFQMLYENRWESLSGGDRDLNGNGTIDSGERWNAFDSNDIGAHTSYLPPAETTSFELGLDWNFVTEYVMGLTTYYKSAGNQYGSASQNWRDAASPAYVQGRGPGYRPGNYRDTRGFELSLRKQFSKMFSFSLAYNMQWAEGGSNSAGRRDVFPDSLFVARGHYWTTYDIDPATGRQLPVDLQTLAARDGRDDPDFYVKLWGKSANDQIRSHQNGLDQYSPWSWVPWSSHYASDGVQFHAGEAYDTSLYDDADRAYWERVNADPNYPGFGEANLLVGHSHESSERAPIARDRRAFGSMTFLLATPSDFGPWSGKALGSMRANMVYRVFTGSRFSYVSLVRGVESYKMGPMHTRADLNVEKQFGGGSGVNLTVAAEVYNLFNQMDNRQAGYSGRSVDFDAVRWQKWGVATLEPTSGDYGTYGEINDINNYWDQPREMNFSLRIKW